MEEQKKQGKKWLTYIISLFTSDWSSTEGWESLRVLDIRWGVSTPTGAPIGTPRTPGPLAAGGWYLREGGTYLLDAAGISGITASITSREVHRRKTPVKILLAKSNKEPLT